MKQIFLIFISCLIGSALIAQQNKAETSHYLFPEFSQGVVLMKDGIRNEALLNYNSLTEEMVFDNNGEKRAIGNNELLLVDTVFIKDGKFVVLNGKFVELVHHSTWHLFVEHRCKAVETGKPAGYGGTSQTSAATSVSSLYSQGRVVYNLKLPDNFNVKPYRIYLLKKNGEINKFANMRELKKLYKDEKDLLKKYLKTNPVEFDDQEGIIQFIKYLESNPEQ
jgi:hypothetical protein